MIVKELYFHNGKAYVILRKIPLHSICDKSGKPIPERFAAWKEWLGADHVLKTQTHFLYCETVTDVEWEDVPEEEYIEKTGTHASTDPDIQG